MNQVARAAELALKTCPRSSWRPQVIYDHGNQRLALETMKRQLLDEAFRAQAKLFVMITQWALAGTWPKFRNAPVYFLNEILTSVASRKSFRPEEDFPETSPPWDSKYAAHFLDRTALSWYSVQSDVWARDLASSAFDLQESEFADMHPRD